MKRTSGFPGHLVPAVLAGLLAAGVGATSVMAMGDAGDARYDRYVMSLGTQVAAPDAQQPSGQRATVAVDEAGGGDTYSGLEASPFHISNSKQHRGGADR